MTLLNRSVRMHPEHTASWVALGLLNERNRRIDEARGCFRTATSNDPRNHYAWLVRTIVVCCLGLVALINLVSCSPTGEQSVACLHLMKYHERFANSAVLLFCFCVLPIVLQTPSVAGMG